MKRTLSILVLTLASSAVALGCGTPDATYAVIDDGYAGVPEGGDPSQSIAVYRGWWLVATFADPVGGGQSSANERVVTGSDHAYFVLAPGWDPTSGTTPTQLLPAMSTQPLSIDRGGTLHIQVDDAHVLGNCAAGQPLTQDQADFITQSIFPGAFAGVTYDAATCTLTAVADAGAVDAAGDGQDGGSGG